MNERDVPKLKFFPHLWVPVFPNIRKLYDSIELERYRVLTVSTEDGDIDYKEALKARNASISSLAQRASILMSALSLLIGAHIVLWINLYKYRVDDGHHVVIGGIFLCVALILILTTLWFHWSGELEDYKTEKAEYLRTGWLVKTRAYRVNLAILLVFIGFLCTSSGYTIIPLLYFGYNMFVFFSN